MQYYLRTKRCMLFWVAIAPTIITMHGWTKYGRRARSRSTPIPASRLNQMADWIWFEILSRNALKNANFNESDSIQKVYFLWSSIGKLRAGAAGLRQTPCVACNRTTKWRLTRMRSFQMLKPAPSRNNAKTRFFTIKINTLKARKLFGIKFIHASASAPCFEIPNLILKSDWSVER